MNNLGKILEQMGRYREAYDAYKLVADDPNAGAAGASPYLRMFGMTVGGYLIAKGGLAAARMAGNGDADRPFLAGRVATARFYGEQLLPQVPALLPSITAGAAPLFAIKANLLVN